MKSLTLHFIYLLKPIVALESPLHNLRKLFVFHQRAYNQTNLSIGYRQTIRPISASSSHSTASENQIDEHEADNCLYSVVGVLDDLCKVGRLKEAVSLLHRTNQQHILWDSNVYATLLQGCVDGKAMEEAKRVHLHMIKYGFKLGIFLSNRLVDVYAKCGSVEDARQVFDKMSLPDVVSWTTMIACYAKGGRVEEARELFDRMPERNVVSWNAMIAGYAQHGYPHEALELFCGMQKEGVMPNSVTFVGVLSASADLAILEMGKQIHALIRIAGLELNVFVGSALVDMYTKCKCLDDAQKVFNKMPERNVVSWNTMIDGYAKYGDISKARKLFDEMPERSVASWTAMMAGYAQAEHAEEAFELFRRMQYGCTKPDQFTYACVLSICASLVVLEHGKQVHARSIRTGFKPHVSVGNGLLTMYSKCGSIEDAHNVFRRMPEHNLVSWTAMVSGCAMNGLADDAFQFFGQMQQAGVKPDCITFLGVLSACSHAGLLNLGCYYFDSMSREHGIIPTTDHYSCMIDLFGRAGQLDVAKNIIDSMPFEPDARIWAALLGACRINDNAELGILAAKHLFELEPQNCATYILLSNIYAVAGSWDDVAKVRRMMKERGIKKMPGWSWIEVKNKVHTFLAGDKSHPQMEQQTD